MNNKTYLTSIYSLRGLKSRTFLTFQITTFNYFLDGSYKKVILIGTKNFSPVTPEKSIRKAKEIQESKKANHKPDSVLIAS